MLTEIKFQIRRSNRDVLARPFDVTDQAGRIYGRYQTEAQAKRRARDLERYVGADGRFTRNVHLLG